MKAIKRILEASLTLFATNCFGSEITMPLEGKVWASDLVVIGTVTDVRLGDIRMRPELKQRTQDTKIRFQIDEIITGKESGEISIEAHSVSFKERDGLPSTTSTAGFSNYRVKKNERFVAYLKKSNEGYVLAGESVQFLEWIDTESKSVRDVGQTSNMIPLELKINQLRAAAKKKDAQQGGSGQPATRPESKSEGNDKPQPEAEGRSR